MKNKTLKSRYEGGMFRSTARNIGQSNLPTRIHTRTGAPRDAH